MDQDQQDSRAAMKFNFFLKREAKEKPERPEPLASTRFADCFAARYVGWKGSNPHAGNLKIGDIYEIISVGASSIQIVTRNGTRSYLHHRLFEPYHGPGRKMPMDLSGEYDDIVKSQEIMDEMQ